MPLISVIVPTRNRAALVQKAIESILASCTDTIQVEIIVVDDGSTDKTESIVRAYPITYIRGPGKGVSIARNTGLRSATGTYITFLDDDDIWPEHNMRHQVQMLEANPQFGAVCSQVVLTDDTMTATSDPYPNPPFQSGWMFHDFLSYIPQVGSLLVRRDVVSAIGDFESGLQGGEDWDWALRIARYCQIGFVPEVAILWRMHNTARVDGAGNKYPEDITWRRYNDVMLVAHRYVTSNSIKSWLKAQRIILKHKGHYIPLFMSYAEQYAQKGDFLQALRCGWMALRASPIHLVSYTVRTKVKLRYNALSNSKK
jgi:glycosyltransferase involved in cell wall biosynthesis